MAPLSPIVADQRLLFGVWARRRRRVCFSDGWLRVEDGRGGLMQRTAVEDLEDVTIRRRWFSSRLTIRTVRGSVAEVGGLHKKQASRVRDAVHDAAAERASALEGGLIDVDERLHGLLLGGRYVRHSEMPVVHESLVSVVRQCGGLISGRLAAHARDALVRLVDLESVESMEKARRRANEAAVSGLVGAVAAAADAAAGARITDEQAEAIATDEDVTLVLAGAGTGKTTVIAAKIAHLVHNEEVDPGQILVLVFNTKARDEIVGRLRGELSKADVRTFHAFGRGVVAGCEGSPTLSRMAEDDHVRNSQIDAILDGLLTGDETSGVVARYLMYHDEPCYSPFDFETHDEYEAYYRTVELRTLSRDLVKSIEELRIANCLTENGVRFVYEAPYEHPTVTHQRRQYLPDFFLPDYRIYIEHFALDEHDNPPPHWDSYAEGVEWKRKTHRRHGTTLIETFSRDHKRGTWRSTLLSELEVRGVVLSPVPRQDLITLLSETKIRRLSGLLATFLNHAKTSNVSADVLESRARARGDVYRNLAFLDVFGQVRERYERLLTEAGEMDFHDLINRAAGHIRAGRWRSPYRYVLVDEFQDTSAGRMDLLRALGGDGVAYFVVGDDWQSINRFAGSDVSLVRNCGGHLGHVQHRTLTRTFRYGDGILAPSTKFVKRNPEQTQRPLRTASTAPDHGITIVAADDPLEGATSALRDIERLAADRPQEVLALGRYKTAKAHVPAEVEFSTVHSAKGREADYVIVFDLKDIRRGFPSQMTDDAVLELVQPPAGDRAFPFAEERRLFYVALTRARIGSYLITDRQFPSRFVTELLDQSADLSQIGELAPAPWCPRCPNGRLKLSQTGKTMRCTNHPHCEHQAPRCTSCGQGYVLVEQRFESTCTNPDCDEPLDACPSCGLGVMVLIERADKSGTFEGCTEYHSKLQCPYTRSTTRGASRR